MSVGDTLIGRLIMWFVGGLAGIFILVLAFPVLRGGITEANTTIPAAVDNITQYQGAMPAVNAIPLFAWLLILGLWIVAGAMILWPYFRGRGR